MSDYALLCQDDPSLPGTPSSSARHSLRQIRQIPQATEAEIHAAIQTHASSTYGLAETDPETSNGTSEDTPRCAKQPQAASARLAVAKWVVPGLLYLLCVIAQSFGLYVAMYHYIVQMDRLGASLLDRSRAPWLQGGSGSEDAVPDGGGADGRRLGGEGDAAVFGSPGVDQATIAWYAPEGSVQRHLSPHISDGALRDVFADAMGQHDIPMTALGVLCSLVPVVFLVSAVITKDLRLWTKCCICGGFLALLRGFLAWATVVPNSVGWDSFKQCLGPDGLAYIRAKKGFDVKSEVVFSLVNLLWIEALKFDNISHSDHLQFCADMMYSTHIYVCTVFSLGFFELSYRRSAELAPLARAVCRTSVLLALSGLVCADLLLVLLNRFHYTMDVTIALVLVGLLFTNPAVALAAEFWVNGERPVLPLSQNVWQSGGDKQGVGTVMIPPCCFPLCCFLGQYHFYGCADAQESPRDGANRQHLLEMQELESVYREQIEDLQAQLADQTALVERCEQGLQSSWSAYYQEKKKTKELQATLDDSRRVLQGLRAAKGDERRGLEVALEDERVARCRAEDRAQALAEEMLKEERSARRRAEEHAQVLAQELQAREGSVTPPLSPQSSLKVAAVPSTAYSAGAPSPWLASRENSRVPAVLQRVMTPRVRWATECVKDAARSCRDSSRAGALGPGSASREASTGSDGAGGLSPRDETVNV